MLAGAARASAAGLDRLVRLADARPSELLLALWNDSDWQRWQTSPQLAAGQGLKRRRRYKHSSLGLCRTTRHALTSKRIDVGISTYAPVLLGRIRPVVPS